MGSYELLSCNSLIPRAVTATNQKVGSSNLSGRASSHGPSLRSGFRLRPFGFAQGSAFWSASAESRYAIRVPVVSSRYGDSPGEDR